MHTTVYGGTTFQHNGDMSGNVTIIKGDGTSIEVLGKDILGFVAEWVRAVKIYQLEEMPAEQILGLLP